MANNLTFTQVIHGNDHFLKVVDSADGCRLFSKGAAIYTCGNTLLISQHGVTIECDKTNIATIAGASPASTMSGIIDQLYPLLET